MFLDGLESRLCDLKVRCYPGIVAFVHAGNDVLDRTDLAFREKSKEEKSCVIRPELVLEFCQRLLLV